MTQWTHRVVRRATGADGRLFDFPAAGTFGSREDAEAYAAAWSRELGRAPHEITVRTRKGTCSTGRGAIVAVHSDGKRVL